MVTPTHLLDTEICRKVNMNGAKTINTSKSITLLTSKQAAAQLTALKVDFLQAEPEKFGEKEIDPAILIATLAASKEARLRLALIPLLLCHPEFAPTVRQIVPQLLAPAQLVLKCYYTAAQLLQQKYWSRLHALWGDAPLLPDLFCTELGLSTFTSPDHGLHLLAQRHRLLSGRTFNWLGTYEHGAQRLLIHCERKALWQKSTLVKSEPQ